jgi:hypothetical protein
MEKISTDYLWKSSVLPETLHCAVLLCDADDYAILVIHRLFIVIACTDTVIRRGIDRERGPCIHRHL